MITRWGRLKEEKLFCTGYRDRAIPDQKNTLDFLQFLESRDKKRDWGCNYHFSFSFLKSHRLVVVRELEPFPVPTIWYLLFPLYCYNHTARGLRASSASSGSKTSHQRPGIRGRKYSLAAQGKQWGMAGMMVFPNYMIT